MIFKNNYSIPLDTKCPPCIHSFKLSRQNILWWSTVFHFQCKCVRNKYHVKRKNDHVIQSIDNICIVFLHFSVKPLFENMFAVEKHVLLYLFYNSLLSRTWHVRKWLFQMWNICFVVYVPNNSIHIWINLSGKGCIASNLPL